MSEVDRIADAEMQQSNVGTRSAAERVPFFVPHLRPGMSVLECGCGVGSITRDLAARVAPEPVVGIDVGEGQLAVARSEADRRGLNKVASNSRMRTSSRSPRLVRRRARPHSVGPFAGSGAGATGAAARAQARWSRLRLRRRDQRAESR